MSELPDAAFVPTARELSDPSGVASFTAGEKRSVIFFEMTACPYCVACRERFADLVRERPDLLFARVLLNDPGHPLWNQYGIHAVPTVIAFEKGEIVARADSILALGLSKKRWSEFLSKI
jgi:hypothetical protein